MLWNILCEDRWLYYIDEVFSKASPQVLYEGCLAVVVFQQDKVLHPDPVPGSQGALHHQTHSSFNINLLQEERELHPSTLLQMVEESIILVHYLWTSRLPTTKSLDP